MLLGLFRLSWNWVKFAKLLYVVKSTLFSQSGLGGFRIVTIFPIIVDRGDNNMLVIT